MEEGCSASSRERLAQNLTESLLEKKRKSKGVVFGMGDKIKNEWIAGVYRDKGAGYGLSSKTKPKHVKTKKEMGLKHYFCFFF